MLASKHANQMRAFYIDASERMDCVNTGLFYIHGHSPDFLPFTMQNLIMDRKEQTMFLTDEQYIHAISLYNEEAEPSPLLTKLSAWAEKQYGIKVIDYICDKRLDGMLRLVPVLWDDKEVRTLMMLGNYNPEIQHAFAKKFAELCRKYDMHEGYAKPKNFFVAYETLKDEPERHAVQSTAEEIA